MSLLGGITGALSGGSAGGFLGAIAGGLTGAAMPTTGYKDPKASGHGMGYQLAGYDYATAQLLKARASQVGAPYPIGVKPAVMPGAAPLQTSLVGGMPTATSIVGASALNPLGQIIAGAGAAALNSLSPAQQAANNATALYRQLTGQSGGATKKRRRMNPMNIRAARRAIRRIRGARRVLMRIERSMPKARSHTRRRA